jgi:hypothetical protein
VDLKIKSYHFTFYLISIMLNVSQVFWSQIFVWQERDEFLFSKSKNHKDWATKMKNTPNGGGGLSLYYLVLICWLIWDWSYFLDFELNLKAPTVFCNVFIFEVLYILLFLGKISFSLVLNIFFVVSGRNHRKVLCTVAYKVFLAIYKTFFYILRFTIP